MCAQFHKLHAITIYSASKSCAPKPYFFQQKLWFHPHPLTADPSARLHPTLDWSSKPPRTPPSLDFDMTICKTLWQHFTRTLDRAAGAEKTFIYVQCMAIKVCASNPEKEVWKCECLLSHPGTWVKGKTKGGGPAKDQGKHIWQMRKRKYSHQGETTGTGAVRRSGKHFLGLQQLTTGRAPHCSLAVPPTRPPRLSCLSASSVSDSDSFPFQFPAFPSPFFHIF